MLFFLFSRDVLDEILDLIESVSEGFTWLSLVMSMMVSFYAVFLFSRDVLDEILDLIESVSEGFPTYSFQRTSLAITRINVGGRQQLVSEA